MSRSGYGSSNHPDPDLPDVRLPEMEIRILPTLKKTGKTAIFHSPRILYLYTV